MTRGARAGRERRARALAPALLLAVAGCGEGVDRGTRGAVDAAPVVPPGAVPLGAAAYAAELDAPGPPVTPGLLAEGRSAWLGKCAPCHGGDLAGDGPVVQHGFPRPPPLDPRAFDATEIVAVVTHGRGAMPALAVQVTPRERWAIARWLEAR